jgi:hypothetical protein
MKKSIYLILVLAMVGLFSCEKMIMKPNPETSNIAVFNEYAKLVKEKFGMLEYKGLDIDHLKDSIGATITEDLNEDELFDKLAIITRKLRDGHSSIEKEDTLYYYEFYEGYPPGIDREILLNYYIGKDVAPDIIWVRDKETGETKYIYGHMPQSSDIGYLRVGSWMSVISKEEIEKIFATFKNDKGLIFDLRDNGGGDPMLSTQMASYFTDKEIYLGHEQFKIGPGKNDFVSSDIYLKPSGSANAFLKEVMVLTDIWCFSATTTFMYSLNPLDHISFVGQKSGGGAGSVADGHLANGWKWDLSVSEFIDLNGNHWDEGHEPDIAVALDTTITDKDEVIERALLELNK